MRRGRGETAALLGLYVVPLAVVVVLLVLVDLVVLAVALVVVEVVVVALVRRSQRARTEPVAVTAGSTGPRLRRPGDSTTGGGTTGGGTTGDGMPGGKALAVSAAVLTAIVGATAVLAVVAARLG